MLDVTKLDSKFLEMLHERGGKVSEYTGKNYSATKINIPANGVYNLWETFKVDNKYKTHKNYKYHNSTFDDGRNSFHGGSPECFIEANTGKLDLTDFIRAKEKIKGITKNLSDKVEEIAPMRKRRRDEYDGEIDFDKRFEPMPYIRAYRENTGIQKTLKVNVEFGFNCSVDAESISKYGAFCWAVVDAIESAGICCEVNLVGSSRGQCHKGVVSNNLDWEINVKKPGEYIETIELARRFRADFFRRGIFSLFMFNCALTKGETDSGLGSSQDKYQEGVLSDGELRLCIQDALKFDEKKAIKMIKDALGIKDE